MTKAQEELQTVLRLLELEKQADLAYYQEKVLNTSLEDKRKEGVCWYPVILSKQRYNLAEKLVIKVERTAQKDKPHMFQSGKVVSLFANSSRMHAQNLSGVVNNVSGNMMMITLNAEELPEWVFEEKLGIDLLFDELAYREMESAMKVVTEAQNNRIAELREILLGGQLPEFSETYPISVPKLNASQNEALNKVLRAKDIAIIHGPPGTGKTTTIVQAISHTLKAENQVLVCAPSNAAADLLTEKLHDEGVRVVRIGHPARVTEINLSKTIDAQIANHDSYKDLRALRRKSEEYREMGLKYKRNFGPAEREQRKFLLREAGKMRGEAEQLEHYITTDILSAADVITCTLVGAANGLIKGMKFNTVFIDEASQALEPACWIALLRAKRVVMAGDHFQLPPTIKSSEAASDGLSETLFAKCIDRKKAQGIPVDQMLRTQYRMHEKIMHFSSTYFYEGKLEADDTVKSRTLGDLPPVTFIDTAGCGYDEKVEEGSRSTFNEEEGTLLLRHLNDLVEKLGTEKIMEENITFGVITPYKAQVRFLSEHYLHHEALKAVESQITIDSVDAFQGRERDVIYISLVRSNDKGEIGFLSDTRRMNVAMTRAKMVLVMTGDTATLGNHPFYSAVLDYVTGINAYQSAFELIY